MPGDFVFFGIASILSPLVFLVLVLVVAVAIGSTRGEPDPRRLRLKATYLSLVLFLSLFAALFAATGAMGSLMDMTQDDDSEVSFEEDESFDESDVSFDHDDGYDDSEGDAAGLVQALVVAGVAGAVAVYHRRKLAELTEEEGFRDSPAATAFAAYLYTTSLIALIAFVAGASMGLYGFAQVVAPGALSADDADFAREEGARQMFTGAFLALASLAIVVLHHREHGRLDEPTTEPDPIA